MLSTLSRLWSRFQQWKSRRAPQRKIFEYWDGTRFRAADPIQAYYKLLDHDEFVPKVHGPLVDKGDPEATRIVCDAVCEAFDVRMWSEAEGGLTIPELLMLHVSFCEYLNGLKKNIEPMQTWPSPTESISKESENPTTNDTSGSLSADTVKKSDMPIE